MQKCLVPLCLELIKVVVVKLETEQVFETHDLCFRMRSLHIFDTQPIHLSSIQHLSFFHQFLFLELNMLLQCSFHQRQKGGGQLHTQCVKSFVILKSFQRFTGGCFGDPG